MSGSVFFTGIVVLVGIVCSIFITPILLIPTILLALGIFFAGSLFGAKGVRTAGSDATGVPSTSEATYDPVGQPSDQAV
jgi:hypothetical protein